MLHLALCSMRPMCKQLLRLEAWYQCVHTVQAKLALGIGSWSDLAWACVVGEGGNAV